MIKLNVNFVINAPTPNYPERSFKIERYIQEGTQGVVYLATQQKGNPTIINLALKIQAYIYEEERVFIQNMINYQNKYESPTAQQNFPSYIIRIYELIKWQNNTIVVMEIGNTCLHQYLRRNLELQDKQDICLQLLKSIQMLHHLQFTHRDIKPENFIQVGNVWKLCDFGLTKGNQLLETKQIGTIYYMAPEILRENQTKYTEKVDIWALGCTFYEIIAGKELFQGNSIVQQGNNAEMIGKAILMANEVKGQQLSYIQFKINELQISQIWKETIIKMLCEDPQQRWTALQIMNKIHSATIAPAQNKNILRIKPSSIIKQLPQNVQIQRVQLNNQQPIINPPIINGQQNINNQNQLIANPQNHNGQEQNVQKISINQNQNKFINGSPHKFQPQEFNGQLKDNNFQKMNQQPQQPNQLNPQFRFTPNIEQQQFKFDQKHLEEINKKLTDQDQQIKQIQNDQIRTSSFSLNQYLHSADVDQLNPETQALLNQLYEKLKEFLKKN